MIHMKHQALFSLKDKGKKLKCRLLQFLFVALRIKVCHFVSCNYLNNLSVNIKGQPKYSIYHGYIFLAKYFFCKKKKKKKNIKIHSSYIILKNQRLKGKQCSSRWSSLLLWAAHQVAVHKFSYFRL